MPKRSSIKRPSRASLRPFLDPEPKRSSIKQVPSKASPQSKTKKNPAAVALGRLGGLKGGKARAEKLSPKRRKDIAQKAALGRWGATAEDRYWKKVEAYVLKRARAVVRKWYLDKLRPHKKRAAEIIRGEKIRNKLKRQRVLETLAGVAWDEYEILDYEGIPNALCAEYSETEAQRVLNDWFQEAMNVVPSPAVENGPTAVDWDEIRSQIQSKAKPPTQRFKDLKF